MRGPQTQPSAKERGGRMRVFVIALVLLVIALAGGAVLVAGWLRPSAEADATDSSGAVPSLSAEPASTEPPASSPSAPPVAADLAGRVLFAEADGLRLRAEASADADVLAMLDRGQLMGATGNHSTADGMTWYEVRIGPGSLAGWVASGPDRAWLRLVEDGGIAFACQGCGSEDSLVSISPTGDGALAVIGPTQSLMDWSWAPDGTRLAVTKVDDTGTSVAVMSADGSGSREIGPNGYAPDWSPDATRLAWSTPDGLVVTDEQLRPTTIDLEIRNAGAAQWSPDGTRLGVSALHCPECPPDQPIMGDPPSAIYTVGVDGSGLRQLTRGMYDGFVSWAADGSRVAIVRHDLSGELPTQAFTLPTEGGSETPVLGGQAVVLGPSWSPDGTRMALVTPDGLMVLDGDGANPRIVAPPGEAGIFEVAWSPSGRQLLYVTGGSSQDVGLDLYVVPADGSGPSIRITPEAWASRQAIWQPMLAPLP